MLRPLLLLVLLINPTFIGAQEAVERDLEKLGNVLKMRERSMLYGMKLETKLGRLNQMLEVRKP